MNFEFSARKEKKIEKKPGEKLSEMMNILAKEINSDLKKYTELPDQAGDIVDNECRIDMRSFLTKRGGPYSKEGKEGKRGVTDDERTVRTHELAWSGAREEWAKKWYATDDENVILRKWMEKESESDGSLAEKAVVHILNRFLKGRFIAVRSAPYDDYENGVDTLILDKETGVTVCSFDEVVGAEEGDRYRHKIDRAKERLRKRGGMQVRYGLSFDRQPSGNMRLERKSLPNIPGFCVSLSKEELRRLLDDPGFFRSGDPSDAEIWTFEGIVESLSTQEDRMKEGMSMQQSAQVGSLVEFAREALGKMKR